MKLFNPGCGCCVCTCRSMGDGSCIPPGTALKDRWTFSMSGVTNSLCSGCSVYNDDWTLCWDPSVAKFTTAKIHGQTTHCGSGTLYHYEMYRATGQWNIDAVDSDAFIHKRWAQSTSSFACDAANVLSALPGGISDCSGWPATVTVTPC